nr:MAG TPA: hypothetical protein [Caudoviricetes sp.]
MPPLKNYCLINLTSEFALLSSLCIKNKVSYIKFTSRQYDNFVLK